MKATLKFNLNNPEDSISHLRCLKSLDMAIALFQFSSNAKKRIINNKGRKVDIDTVFEEFNKILEDNNLDLDKLIN